MPTIARCAEPGCGNGAAAGAPLALCADHLLLAYDWVSREVGVTDVLPSPCLACGSRLGVQYPSGWLCAICEWRVGALPDSELPDPRVDIVYYLRFRDRIKIGTTGNLRGRMQQLVHDELLAVERGGRELEQWRHRQFAEHRLDRTEWFGPHPELDAHIATLRRGGIEPTALAARWRSELLALGRG